MSNIDIDISAQYSKTLDRFLDNEFDFVITVCDNANEACPYFKNGKQRLHWSFQDPSQAVGGARAVTYDETLQKLADFYAISDITGALNEVASVSGPRRPTWSQFKKQNKLGFLNGVLTYAPDPLKEEYVAKLYWTFGSSTLPEAETDEERSCLNLLYARFIEPFKQRASSNASPYGSTPSTPIGSSIALDLNAVDPTHANFRSALHKRDEVCLFCWGNLQLDAAHLIAQKPSPSLSLIIPDLLSRAGLDSVDRVQNGILLCKVCHGEFDALRRYIDVVDDRFVAKVVNLTSDPRNQEYIDAVGGIEDSRTGKIRRNPAFAGRTVVDGSNELPVYFADGDTTKHPNLTALAFHKAACLIWKMAGAADDIEDDDIDHDGSVDSLLAKVSDRLRHLQT
ncbi:hypothetical protein HDU83_000506 [Entophlyctis luteolus]|nr:hypothetical protein HDU83_000506 [Entophlyctis luteolus]